MATRDETAIARAGGTRRTILITTIAGGTRTSGLRTKARSRSVSSSPAPVAAAVASGTGSNREANAYSAKASRKDGTAVYIMWRMCSYRSAPAPIAQMFVESDRGDILSPK